MYMLLESITNSPPHHSLGSEPATFWPPLPSTFLTLLTLPLCIWQMSEAKLQQFRPTVKQCDGADGVECPVKTTQSTLSSQLIPFFLFFLCRRRGGGRGAVIKWSWTLLRVKRKLGWQNEKSLTNWILNIVFKCFFIPQLLWKWSQLILSLLSRRARR